MSKNNPNHVKICHNTSYGKKAYADYLVSKSADVVSREEVPCADFVIFPGLPLIQKGNNYTMAYIRLYIKPNIKIKSIIIYYDSHT